MGQFSPNYDVTAVSSTGAYNNTTSFKKKEDGKYEFTGTIWNDTSYVKNDKNKDVSFKDGQEMTIQLNSRYFNGKDATYANLDKRHTGISFDLLDKFIEAAARGELEDVDHKGYTRENMMAFGKAFDDLQAQKRKESQNNPYKKAYTNMKDKTSFTFSADELKTSYEAAGFRLTKKEKQEPKKEKVQPAKVEVKEEQPKVQEPGQFAIGTEAQFKSTEAEKNAQQAVDDLIAAGVINKDETEVDIDFGGTVNEGKASETQVTANGQTVVGEQGDKEDVKIAKEEVKNPTMEINGKTYKVRMKDGKLQVKRTGLFRGWKDYHEVAGEPAPEEKSVKAAADITTQKAEAETVKEADAVKTNEAEQAKADYYKKHVTDTMFWNSYTTIEPKYFGDDNVRSIYQVKEVTTADGKRILQVNKTTGQDKATNYYEVKVDDSQGYMRLAPDLEKELKDVELAK